MVNGKVPNQRTRTPLRVAGALALSAVAAGGAGLACTGAEAAAGGDPQDSTLTRLVAEIQPAVEQSSGIEARSPVHVARADSARLRAYIEEQLRSELPPPKVTALTAAYARLGLLPDTLDLTALLRSLLEEQVVGYYDPERDTLYVMDDVPTAQLEVVLAHELVHALQDQRVDLDSLRRTLRDRNDATMGAQAAIEGHATYAMTEWQIGRVTGGAADLTLLPDLGEQLGGVDLTAMADGGSVEVLRAAPAVIREGLIFPYIHGLAFVQRMWKARDGRPLPFDADLPRSTEQVLHLDRYLEGDAPTRIELTRPLPAGWETVYESDLGELETRIFLAEHLGDRERADQAAAGWDGDAYRLVRGPPGEAFAWVSAWDSPDDAAEFAAAVEAAYTARYPGNEAVSRRVTVRRETVGGSPAVVVVDAPAGASPQLDATLARAAGG